MSTLTASTRSTTFKTGWLALLVISVLATLNFIAMIFIYPDEGVLSIGWAAYTAYASVVLWVPFRRAEKWAWYTSWILVIGFALPILLTGESWAVWFLATAGVMAVSLLLTRPAFFANPRLSASH